MTVTRRCGTIRAVLHETERWRTTVAKAKRKPTDIVGLQLRFTEELRARLEQDAKDNHRSLNGEIVHRLATSYGADGLRLAAQFEDAEQEMLKVIRDAVNYAIAVSKAKREAEHGEQPPKPEPMKRRI
jgi:hypothetical protein